MLKFGGPPADSEGKHYQLLWVPPDHREPVSLTMSVIGWRWIRIAIVMLAVMLIGMVITWGVFLRQALSYDRLVQENKSLKVSVVKLDEMRMQLESLQILDDQVRRALGSRPGLTAEDRALLRERYRSKQFSSSSRSGQELSDVTFLPTLMPTVGLVSRHFTNSPFAGNEGHRGIDIASASGTPIIAAASGTVLFSGWTQQYGNTLLVGHPSGYTTMYGHAQMFFWNAGDIVRQGEPIGLVGSTGKSTGPHLHFEVWKENSVIDPMTMISENRFTANKR
ncbi:MAG: M23 family metallopeptidase [bacterium]|nr:M23 family metallopeptidase [bacterium]